MRILPTRRAVGAGLAAAALLAASAVSLAPAAPAGERTDDPRFVVVGSSTLPLDGETVVADLDRLERATSLAALLDDAHALDLSALLAPDGDLEAFVETVREADAVVVVARDRDEVAAPDDAAQGATGDASLGQDSVPADDGAAQDDGAHDDGAHSDDSHDDASHEDGSIRVEGDACRAQVVAWLATLGTPTVLVTDAGHQPEDGAAETPGHVATSGDPDQPEIDVVHVLDAAVEDQDVAAVLTGKSEPTGRLPESPKPNGDPVEPVECPELPEAAPAPEPPEAPSDPEPGPDPSPTPEPAPDETPDPDQVPGPDQSPEPDQVPDPDQTAEPAPTPPDDDAPGTEAPDAPETDLPQVDGPEAEAPDDDELLAEGPGVVAPRVPELDGPPAPGPPGPPAPGPPPDMRTPDLVNLSRPPARTPWRLPTFKPTGDPLALSVAPGGLDLSDVKIDGDLIRLSGELPGITVVDHRKSTARGWTLSAQVSDLEGPAVLPASQLGWTPRVHGKRVEPGPAVMPALSGGPGLAHAAVLGTAPRGTADGPVELDAAVVLETTRDAAPGEYAGVITLTLFPTE